MIGTESQVLPGFAINPRLWEPQARSLATTIALIEEGLDVLLYAPTGGGKTTVAVELSKYAETCGLGSCFYLNRKLLVKQTKDRYDAEGMVTGVRAADYDDEFLPVAPHQICSADTERSRVLGTEKWPLHKAGLVIVDEGHMQKTNTMQSLLAMHRANGARVVTMTATPVNMRAWADVLVVSGTMKEYRDCGALVYAVTKSIEQPDLRKVKRTLTGEYKLDAEKRKQYTHQIVANVIDRWKLYNPDARPTMLYAPGVAESVWLTKQFTDAGVPWAHVDATDAVLDGKRRKLTRSLWQEILERFSDGDIRGLSSRFKCLDMDTEVLTRDGWKGFADCDGEAEVATMNLDGSVLWSVPTRTFHGLHRGHWFNLKNSSVDIRVTDDHDMVVRSLDRKCVKWKKESAAEVHKRGGGYQIPVAATEDVPDYALLTDSQIAMIGWMMTDGHVRDYGAWSINQSTSQPEYIHEHIVATMKGCGFTPSIGRYSSELNGKLFSHVRYSVGVASVRSSGLSAFMDKSFSQKLFNLSRRQLLVLLYSINLADGAKPRSPSCSQKTLVIGKGNKDFLSRLQALCVVRGMRANISLGGDCPLLFVTPGRTHACIRGQTVSENDGHTRIRSVMSYSSEEKWCLEVPAGTLITRRNGKVAIVGNCKEGIDIPHAYHAILATPIGSLASYIQIVGRVLRAAPNKTHALITDHGGNYWRHGSPNHDRPWDLLWDLPNRAADVRHQAQIKMGEIFEPIRCPQCESERVGGAQCPFCGFEHEKSVRRVIMADGAMDTVEGKMVHKRYIKEEFDTEKNWSKMFFGYRNKAVKASFLQMEGFFSREYGYHPPRDLPYMPKDSSDWYRHVYQVPFNRLSLPFDPPLDVDGNWDNDIPSFDE